MDRIPLLRSFFDENEIGLEIGAGFNPLVTKNSGARVETVDHATADELREKYRNAPVDISRIEEVDYVLKGQTLLEAVGKPSHYDWIVASHVIEHVPDLVRFLKDCEALLKPTGDLVLAVPDKRRCFDAFQRCSSTGEALQAYVEGRRKPSPGLLFDSIAYEALRGGKPAWHEDDHSPLVMSGNLAEAKAVFDWSLGNTEYRDAHAWQFTPSLFRLIIQDLHDIGLTALCEKKFVPGDAVEFYSVLSKDGRGCPIRRQTLALLALVEQQEILVADPNEVAQLEGSLGYAAK